MSVEYKTSTFVHQVHEDELWQLRVSFQQLDHMSWSQWVNSTIDLRAEDLQQRSMQPPQHAFFLASWTLEHSIGFSHGWCRLEISGRGVTNQMLDRGHREWRHWWDALPTQLAHWVASSDWVLVRERSFIWRWGPGGGEIDTDLQLLYRLLGQPHGKSSIQTKNLYPRWGQHYGPVRMSNTDLEVFQRSETG